MVTVGGTECDTIQLESKNTYTEYRGLLENPLDEDVALRQNVAKRYIAEIKNPKVRLPVVPDFAAHAFHLFPIFCENRDELQKYLAEKGIGTNIHYPIPPHKQECYKEGNDISLPVTEKIHETELSLPMGPCLDDEQVKYVIDCINNW